MTATSRLVFGDLVGPDREPDDDERRWLARVAAGTDPTALTISLGNSMAAIDPGPVLEPQIDGTWRAGRYIGEIRRDGRILEIRPRLGVGCIAAWAGAVLNVRIIPQAAEHTVTSTLIAELVAATWRAALVDAARTGLPGFRSPRQHTGAYARGQLDMGATVRLRATRQPQLVSVSRSKDIDNPVSRSIVLADRVLARRMRRPDWRGERVEELIPRLRGATGRRPTLPNRRQLEAVRYTPITERYRRVAEISWQIAHNRGLRAAATGEGLDGLLIDVAELWELFLVHCARRAVGAAAVTHGTHLLSARTHLSSSKDASRTLGRLFPDLLIGPRGAPTALIDAKYKPLAGARGVDREDRYQITSYLTAHATANRPLIGALAYPAFDDVVRADAERHGPWITHDGHCVHFTRLPVSETKCVAAVAEMLQAT
jgi:5-methylcytosine-specific restriction enzyme subunit McrC